MSSVDASRESTGSTEHQSDELEEIELSLLLEGIFRNYGFDFREYAPASLRRRVWRRVHAEGLSTISALQDKLLHDPVCMERLLLDLSINVTAMFRSTGEEVYSLAILLREDEVYDRTRIYATDINESVLDRARSGVFPLDKMREYTQNYIKAGGTRAFSEYYLAKYDGAQFQRSLIENVVFAQHNLVSDRSFNEFNVIVCRNVMIYFDRRLQDRVHRLFYESLVTFGVLGLGHKESIQFSPHEESFEELDPNERLYRKVR